MERRSISTQWSTVLVWLAILATSALAAAQGDAELDAKLRARRPKVPGVVKLRTLTARAAVRSDAPFSAEFEVESTFEDLLDGELNFTFLDGQQVLLRQQVDAFVIPNGKKSFRLTFPSMAVVRDQVDFNARVQYVTAKGVLDLGAVDMIVPPMGQRQFLIAAPGLRDAAVTRLARNLALDQYRSRDSNGRLHETLQPRRPELLTLPVELDLHELSASPIELYPFDLVVLTGEYFARLSPKQLEAVADWIEGGGGAVIIPTGVLTPSHAQFLTRVFGGGRDAPVFTLDPLGRLVPDPGTSKNGMIACRYGCGRALALRTMPKFNADGAVAQMDPALWTSAVCFVWNVRPGQTAAILKDGTWKRPDTSREVHLGPNQRMRVDDGPPPFEPVEFSKADGLRHLVFPEEVHVVPFSVVATILTLFLLAIAPGDYFVLGLLRRRRYTWILFPALCVLFTILTVHVAGRYTGTIDHRDALVIVDVGEGGRPLRTTRIEQVITAGTRTVSTEVHDGIFVPTDVQPARPVERPESVAGSPYPATNYPAPKATYTAAGSRRGARRSLTSADDDGSSDREAPSPPEYAGSFPLAFHVGRLSRQWTPAIHRLTRIGSERTIPSLRWSDLDSIDATSTAGQKAIIELARRAAPQCELLFVHGRDNSVPVFLSGPALLSGPVLLSGKVSEFGERFQEWPAVLTCLARRPEPGLFSLVSQISPNGAGNLEDLSILAGDEPGACAVHVAVREGNDLVVYRRIVRPKRRVELQ